MEKSDLLYLMDLVDKYFPGREPTPEIMGRAYFREEQNFQRMESAMQNGVAKAFGEG